MITLSKSKYLAGLQCPLLLWYYYNAPGEIPEADEAKQAIFNQGREIEKYAHKLFKGAILVPFNKDLAVTVVKTAKLLSKKRTLFEASFLHDHSYVRVDVLVPVGDEWDLIEIKSGTQVKDVNLLDVAFQKHCLTACGLKVRKCYLMHINKEYVRKGRIEPAKLLVKEDVTSLINPLLAGIDGQIDSMMKVIASASVKASIGPHCNDPYECPMIASCWKFLPEHNVTELYRIGKKKFELIQNGKLHISEVTELSAVQMIQQKAVVDGQRHVDKARIKEFLDGLKKPLYFFDFETLSTAIPLFNGVRPYQNIPFQYSLDVDGTHYEFLASGRKDPRLKLLRQLRKEIGTTGTVIAYNASFEKNVLKGLATSFVKEAKWIEAVIARVEDLLVPFRSFHYYHPLQHGSCSIKQVLPAMTGKDYSDIDVCGDTAGLEWLRINYTKVPKKEKERVREELLKYCGQDTKSMVDVVNELRREVD